jgi:hypothetical protein
MYTPVVTLLFHVLMQSLSPFLPWFSVFLNTKTNKAVIYFVCLCNIDLVISTIHICHYKFVQKCSEKEIPLSIAYLTSVKLLCYVCLYLYFVPFTLLGSITSYLFCTKMQNRIYRFWARSLK